MIIYETFKTVFHPISKHFDFESCHKMCAAWLVFNCLLSIWNYNEIQSSMLSCLIYFVYATAYLSRFHVRWFAIENIPVELDSNIQNIKLCVSLDTAKCQQGIRAVLGKYWTKIYTYIHLKQDITWLLTNCQLTINWVSVDY